MTAINGTIYDDSFGSTASNDSLLGLGGEDTLYANAGGEYLYGGDDTDILYGSYGGAATLLTRMYGDGGDDFIHGSTYKDQMFGGTGSDWMGLSYGNDTLYGGTDAGAFDTISFHDVSSVAITFTLAGSGVGTVTLANSGGSGVTKYYGIEGVEGGSADDHLTGNAGANDLAGGIGNDVLSGLAGNDLLIGGYDHDTLTGGSGADYFAFDGGGPGSGFGPPALISARTSDTVADFNPNVDSLLFNTGNFKTLHATADEVGKMANDYHIFNLLPSEFVTQDTRYAHTLSAHLIYDRVDGRLYYDADGALSYYHSIVVADIGKNLTIDASHLYLY